MNDAFDNAKDDKAILEKLTLLDPLDAGSLAQEYRRIQEQIDLLENRGKAVKDNLKGLLPYVPDSPTPLTWQYGDVAVQWVKGRSTKKLDEKALRRELVLAGVRAEVVETAFEKATTAKTGDPTMRVYAVDEKEPLE